MKQTFFRGVAGSLVSFAAASCGVAQTNVANREQLAQTAVSQGVSVNDRRIPINQRFATLDAYLAWLEKTRAPVDGAWYKQIRPGVFELQTGNLRVLGAEGEVKKTFTRDELERKFGFKS